MQYFSSVCPDSSLWFLRQGTMGTLGDHIANIIFTQGTGCSFWFAQVRRDGQSRQRLGPTCPFSCSSQSPGMFPCTATSGCAGERTVGRKEKLLVAKAITDAKECSEIPGTWSLFIQQRMSHALGWFPKILAWHMHLHRGTNSGTEVIWLHGCSSCREETTTRPAHASFLVKKSCLDLPGHRPEPRITAGGCALLSLCLQEANLRKIFRQGN